MNFHVRLLDCASKGIVEKLRKIESFVDFNYQNEHGSTALMIACHENHIEMVAYLLSLHVNANLQDSLGWTALMFCARDGHNELVDLLLNDEYDTDIDITAQNGINALMCAADAGHFKIAQTLVDRGADVNACTNAGDTALLHSCHGGHTNIVRLLLNANADVNVTGKHLCSPALLAARFGFYEILSQLVQFGGDLGAQDDQGRTVCDFELDGQIGAAIQRGIVARFNKFIIKPTFGPWHGVRRSTGVSDESHTGSTASSPMPHTQQQQPSHTTLNHHNHHTPHPRKGNMAQSHVSTISDSPSSNASSMAHAHPASSRSRTPSPSIVPVRPRKGAPPRSRSESISSNHTHPSNVRIRNNFESTSSSLDVEPLTDAALAELEAGVESILQRQTGSHMAMSSTSPIADNVTQSGDFSTNIVKAARIDSPLTGRRRSRKSITTRTANNTLFLPIRASDNVHSFEPEDEEEEDVRITREPNEDDDEDDEAHGSDSNEDENEVAPDDDDDDDSAIGDHPHESDVGDDAGDARVVTSDSVTRAPRPHPDRPRLSVTSSPPNYMATLDAHLLSSKTPVTGEPTPSPITPTNLTNHIEDQTVEQPVTEPDEPSPLPLTSDSSTLESNSSNVLAIDESISSSSSDSLVAASTLTQSPTASPSLPTGESAESNPLEVALTTNDDQPIQPQMASVPPSETPVLDTPTTATAIETMEQIQSAIEEVAAEAAQATPIETEQIEAAAESLEPLAPPVDAPSLMAVPASVSDGAIPVPSPSRPPVKRRARKNRAPVEITLAPIVPPTTIAKMRFGALPPVAQIGPYTNAQQTITVQQQQQQQTAIGSALPLAQPPSQSQPPATTPSTHPDARRLQELAVDSWLISSGFDGVSRSALHGFTFADLHSLDLNDCVELLGDRTGPMLYGMIKKRIREQGHVAMPVAQIPIATALPSASTPASTMVAVDQPVGPVTSNWAEAAVNGMIAAAAAESDRTSRSHTDSMVDGGSEPDHGSEDESNLTRHVRPATRTSSVASANEADRRSTPAPSPKMRPDATPITSVSSNQPPSIGPASSRSGVVESMPIASPPAHAPMTRTPAIPIAVAAPVHSMTAPVFRSSTASVNAVSHVIAAGRLPEVVTTYQAPTQPHPHSYPSDSPYASPSTVPIDATDVTNSTGFWTRDAINGLAFGFASSLETVKAKMSGRDLREEMRAAQPHRIRRQQQQQQQSTQRTDSISLVSTPPAPSTSPFASAWDVLSPFKKLATSASQYAQTNKY